MITWRNGTVSGTRREWPGAVELDVLLDAVPAAAVRALAYPALTGRSWPGMASSDDGDEGGFSAWEAAE